MSDLNGPQRRVAEQNLVLGAGISTRTQQGQPQTQATSPTSVNASTINSDSSQNRRLSTGSVLEGKENAGKDDEPQAQPTNGPAESSDEMQDDEALSDGTNLEQYEIEFPRRQLETRREAAPKRVKQYFEYIKLMEGSNAILRRAG